MDATPQPPLCQPPPSYLVGRDNRPAYQYFGVCPYAQTLYAYSITHQVSVLFVLPCKRWSCRVCAEAKIKKLAHSVRSARPNRLLTLTIDPSLYVSPRHAWEETRKSVPILIRNLRKRFGEVEYLRVTEVTKAGWPHYHLLVRSSYLPHSVVRTLWNELTGARIVDVRQVTQSFKAYQYLVKYLSKLHKLEWTERHVSYSKAFFAKDNWKPENPLEYAEESFHSFHPANYVAENCVGATLHRLSDHCHLVLPEGHPSDVLRYKAPMDEKPLLGNPQTSVS